MASTTTNRKESERTKLIQEKCQTLLTQMLRDEDNKYCVDCDAKGPRWASWNLGVFLCIRCAGIHRNLGVHISRVKSVNLDTWTPEQVISLQQMGNSRARAVYEAQLPDGFRRPQTDTALESFIRAKYEHKKYLAREWVPPSPPKVDWAKEIDEELEKQKRKKKAAQANSSLGIGILGSEKKPSSIHHNSASTKSVALPAPLPKPKSTTTTAADGSPKTQRVSAAAASNDLLGLSSPTKQGQNLATSAGGGNPSDPNNDSFSNFLSASPAIGNAADNGHETSNGGGNSTQNSLAKDEEDFFNQGSLGGGGLGGTSEKDKSGKLTKDSILALYGTSTTNPLHTGPFGGQPPPQQQHQQQQQQNAMFARVGFSNMNHPAAVAGYGIMPHPQQAQFMTPPNSASMYNNPVMTAPTAFGGVGVGGVGIGIGGGMSYGVPNAFGQQMLVPNSAAGSIQQQSFNMPQTNHNLMAATTGAAGLPPPQLGAFGMGSMSLSAATQPNQATAGNLNQQFGNLNIGNVWQ